MNSSKGNWMSGVQPSLYPNHPPYIPSITDLQPSAPYFVKNPHQETLITSPISAYRPNNQCCSCNAPIQDEDISLPCTHKYCTICIANLLEQTLEQQSPTLMLCVACQSVIPYLTFFDRVDKDSLIEYLAKISKIDSAGHIKIACPNCKALSLQSDPEKLIICRQCSVEYCPKCLHYHPDETCISHYNKLTLISKHVSCHYCYNYALSGLSCACNICTSCLLAHIKESVLSNPLSPIKCKICEADVIPTELIYKVFTSKAAFVNFQENSILAPRFECPICMVPTLVEGSVTIDCEHRFCEKCFKAYLEQLFNAGVDASSINCPDCSVIIPNDIIRAFVNAEILEENEKRLLSRLVPLNNKEMLIICHVCQNGMFVKKKIREFKCPACKNKYCPKCRMQHRQNFCPEERKTLRESIIGKVLSNNIVLKCPKCKGFVAKEGGCNFCKCPWPECQNSVYFCALCKKVLNVITIQQKDHFSHYKLSGPFGLTCNTINNIPDDP
jgi:uncharacterized CHY-type Zn-finger protein